MIPQRAEELFRPVCTMEIELGAVGAALLGWSEPPDPAWLWHAGLPELARVLRDPACPGVDAWPDRVWWTSLRTDPVLVALSEHHARQQPSSIAAAQLRGILAGEHLRRRGLGHLEDLLRRTNEIHELLLRSASEARVAAHADLDDELVRVAGSLLDLVPDGRARALAALLDAEIGCAA